MKQIFPVTSTVLGRFLFFIIFGLLLILFNSVEAQRASDTSGFIPVRGVVVDSSNKTPLVFASVFIQGTNIGTVSNGDGIFILKVPERYSNKLLGFSMMGYKTKLVQMSNSRKGTNRILLQPAVIYVPEIVVRDIDPLQIVRAVREKISNNYAIRSLM